jgi:PleD family two-component response regulator
VVAAASRPGGATALEEWQPKLAGAIAHVIRRGARETDLVTRAAETRFQILLPETTELEAAHFAERIAADCGVWLQALDVPVEVRATAAGVSPQVTLEEALARALAAVESEPAA